MSETKKFQLGEFKFVNAVNEDFNQKVVLESSKHLLRENDIKTVIDVTQIFDDERQQIDTFRIYGELEYLSLFNGLPTDYISFQEFFSNNTGTTKNIFTDFNFYVVKPATDFTDVTSTYDNGYVRNFEVISTIDDIDIYPVGFSNNVFDEQQYAFNFVIDFDIKNSVDGLGFPITELYLYAEYQPQINGNGDAETMTNLNFTGPPSSFTPVTLFPGDVITGDLIQFNLENYSQEALSAQTYTIKTPYDDNVGTKFLVWNYNPFFPIKLKVFSNEINIVNTGNTTYEEVQKIPTYALPLDGDGNFIWRNLLDKGFLDPLTGEGVDYPFVNKRHYLFDNYIISISPDLTDSNTLSIFNQIKFAENELINNTPTSNLNNIGKLCSF